MCQVFCGEHVVEDLLLALLEREPAAAAESAENLEYALADERLFARAAEYINQRRAASDVPPLAPEAIRADFQTVLTMYRRRSDCALVPATTSKVPH